MKLFRWFSYPLLLALLALMLLPALAFAEPAVNPITLILPKAQLWTLIVGALVPLVTYVLNHVGPWVSEPVKAFVLALAAAIAGALVTAITTSVFGFNAQTLQLVVSAIIAAFAAHKLLWLPSGISTLLGGGTNKAPVAPAPAGPTTEARIRGR